MRLPIILICVALAGCGGSEGITVPDVVGKDPGPYPTSYKAILAQHIKAEQFLYPAGLHDAELSEPTQWQFGSNKGWLVCLRANAKDRDGDAGLNTNGYLVSSAGKVDDLIGDDKDCANAKFEPWPEMDSGSEARTSTPRSPKK
ncbi:MAG TPA: hypothetical protein VG271_11315 [Beijerinckiaceae bacterium]|nr:hypothetical protein [Beijerinckiaceae bacterium]